MTAISGIETRSEKALIDDWQLIPPETVESMDSLHQVNASLPGAHIISVPSTVFGALVEGGTVPDPFVGTRLAEVDTAPYRQPWVYRRQFDLDPSLPKDFVELIFEGIQQTGKVWLNGELLADRDAFQGPFKMYRFDISTRVKPENNVLVVQIFPPEKGDLSIGWVDWNPYPPDQNMGLWRSVKVRQSGPISLETPFVRTQLDLNAFEWAELTIESEVCNRSTGLQHAVLELQFDSETVEIPFTLDPGETRKLIAQASDFAQLRLTDPKVWWPNGMGEQPLYTLHAQVKLADDSSVTEQRATRFGIREVSDYLNAQGHRGWKVNGRPVLIRGGGWVDDLFLREHADRLEAQVRYAKHMNLNTLRLEGFFGATQRFYDLCDENGLLVMIGWSCHWEWENYCHRPEDGYLLIRPEENAFHAASYRDQVLWLRNHPSVFLWVFGSDTIPRPELETLLYQHLDEVDGTRPILLGCKSGSNAGEAERKFESETYGPVAVKMKGPYHYVPPIYWFEDRQFGGAYGFNTETGPGLQPVVYDSLKKFTPADKLWPMNEVWDFHTGRGDVFGSFELWKQPFERRYGSFDSAEAFSAWAQVSNYEAMRPMFEAFVSNQPETTGVIQWMYNSSMPNHLWQLFDYYLMPTGAFYAARKANETVQAIYDYAREAILLSNDDHAAVHELEVKATLYDQNSKVLWEHDKRTVMAPKTVQRIADLPGKLLQSAEPGSVFFLDLRIERPDGTELTQNFYWLSQQREQLDYPVSSWYQTPITRAADFRGLRSLPGAQVQSEWKLGESVNGLQSAEVTLTNASDHIAFFVELMIRENVSGEAILPVYWQDNYLSLCPGETRTVRVQYPDQDSTRNAVFSLSLLNPLN